MRHNRTRRVLAAAGVLAGIWMVPATALVLHGREEALRLAFPRADRTEARVFFLSAEHKDEIERRAGARLDSRLLSVYVGHRAGEVSGYAILDTHPVRTLPETILVVLTPAGAVRAVHLLAFYELPEYAPGTRWLQQFAGRQPAERLRVGRGIAAVTGSTLTSHAVTAAVRRALAIHAVLLGGR